MKQIGENELNKVLSVFKEVHREKENLHVGENWQTKVMNHIRKDTGVYSQASFFDIFQQFVWRLAPVSLVLVMVLVFLIYQTNMLSDYELAKIFINDPSDLSFISLYYG